MKKVLSLLIVLVLMLPVLSLAEGPSVDWEGEWYVERIYDGYYYLLPDVIGDMLGWADLSDMTLRIPGIGAIMWLDDQTLLMYSLEGGDLTLLSLVKRDEEGWKCYDDLFFDAMDMMRVEGGQFTALSTGETVSLAVTEDGMLRSGDEAAEVVVYSGDVLEVRPVGAAAYVSPIYGDVGVPSLLLVRADALKDTADDESKGEHP